MIVYICLSIYIVQMVFQGIAQIVLSRFLDKVFYGINKNNIQVELLDGRFVLSNIGLKQSLVTQLNLPIDVKYSYVQRVQIILPWRSDEVSITINISNIYLLVTNTKNSPDVYYESFIRRKQKIIEEALKQFKASMQNKENVNKEYGFIEKIFLNLLDNINIKIECIHLRYENIDKNYSFGVKINEVSARTVDQLDQSAFFNREKSKEEYVRYIIEMDFMGIYFNSKQNYFLSGRQLSQAQITVQFHKLSHKIIKNYEDNFESQQQNANYNYIFTISIKTILKKYIHALQQLSHNKDEKYLFQCEINLNNIESKLSDEQYYDLLDFFNFIFDYQKNYHHLVDRFHFPTYKERKAKELSDLMKKKNKMMIVGKKQKQTLTKASQRYAGSLFMDIYIQCLKKSFIKQAIKKEINVKNLKNNKKAFWIMTKIDNDILKQWILISLYYRKKFQEKVSIFFRGNTDRINNFAQKYINSSKFYYEPYEFQDEIAKSKEQSSENKYQVFLKLNLNIKSFNFEISRQNDLGVGVNLQKLKIELILRKRNYVIKMSIEDLQANVFNSKKYQKKKTYVPIIQRNSILEKNINLLEITYERNPVGRPFIFTEIQAVFESIFVTIYPEIFNQFYEILLGGSQSQKKTKKKLDKRKEGNVNENRSVRQIGFQRTIIKAKVRSPWILLPFTSTNNPSQECWIVRLGDFQVDTLQQDFSKIKTQEEIFYEQYKIQLNRFQFSYFSSINFFHNWLKFNTNLQNLKKIKSYQNQKIINVILPLSCLVELSLLKNTLSLAIRDRKAKSIGKININQIQIRISKFVLNKLKTRFDNFDENKEEANEFIEKNIVNIKQQNQIKGQCKISYGNIKKMVFHCVLKGSFVYFFINEDHPKYHFFVNLNQTAIRFISNEIQNFNTHQTKLLCFYFKNKEYHYAWRKKIMLIISKKERYIDNAFNSYRSTNSYDQNRRSIREILSPSKNSIENQKDEEKEVQNQPSSKLKMKFQMNKLTIILYEENDKQFLNFHIKKASLEYNTVLEKSITFSLNEWIIKQGNGQIFVNSINFIDEKSQESDNNNVNNFLEVCCIFNSITQELRLIQIKVDKLFLAWKVQLFTKILLFFFYEEEAGDSPAPINYNKRQLQVKISVQKLNFHCYFDAELIALSKLQYINVRYFQNNTEQIYDFNCKVFEMDKFINGSSGTRLPMIRRRYTSKEGSNEPIYNNFNLYYLLRKKDTEQFEKVCMLQNKFGKDVLVTQIKTEWKDTEIFFENELTFRLMNYIIVKVIGTIGSKFKKRVYSPNYIFESLKVCKLTIMDVELNNFVFKIPPHERGERQFSCEMEKLHVFKNFERDYMPQEILVETIRGEKKFFWESMLVKISNANLYYHIDLEQPILLLSAPININLILSKLNFLRQFFVILNHHDDVNRNSIVDVIIEKPILLQAHKIFFVTFLQIFYQNIKQKDGKAQIFEPPLPFPSLRQYNIYINKIQLSMYHFLQKDDSPQVFNKFSIDRFKLDYRQIGNESKIKLTAESIKSEKELPIESLDDKRKKFSLQMESKEGEMKIIIDVQYYALMVNLDNLNNILQFFNYDNDYVSNKIMPKKASSWQYVNVFAKNCELKLGKLGVQGQFYISYLKGMKNDPDQEIKAYFSEGKGALKELDWQDITDKEIKVNGEDIRLNIQGDSIGLGSNLCFNRVDITSKSLNKRYKKERVQVGDIDLHIQLVDLKTIWQVYSGHISKNPKWVLKTLYHIQDALPIKLKVMQKRHMQVQINKILISIIPTIKAQIFNYLKLHLEIPLIIYKTYLQQQEVNVNIRYSITHQKERLKETLVSQCQGFKLKYSNIKDKKIKKVQILNAKGIIINLIDLNNYVLSNMIKQIQQLKEIERVNLHLDKQGQTQLKYTICFKNETNKKIKIRMSQIGQFTVGSNQEENQYVSFNKVFKWMNHAKSKLEVHEEGYEIISKDHDEISMFQPIEINKNMLVFSPNNQKLVITYRPCYQIKNISSFVLYMVDDKPLYPLQTISFIPNKSNVLPLQLKIGTMIKTFNVNLKQLEQMFGDDSFMITLIRQDNNMLFEIKDRFMIKNMLPLSIKVAGIDIQPFKEAFLGYVNQKDQQKLWVQVNSQCKFQINLFKPERNIQIQKKIIFIEHKDKEIYQKIPCKIHFQHLINNKSIIIYFFSKFSIKNDCNHSITIIHKDKYILLKAKHKLMLPFDLQQLRWLDNQQQFTVIMNKGKCFFSSFLRFTYIQKLDKKVNVLKIENRYYLSNRTDEQIDILVNQKHREGVLVNEVYELTSKTLKDKSIALLFGDIVKSFDLSIKGMNILKVGGHFLKITVLHQEQSILIVIQDNKTGHLVINKLDDISIIPNAYNVKEMIRSSNTHEYQRTIHPLSEGFIGLQEWNNQVIQLQFYLQAKNIQFRQKFKINFLSLSNKFSHKHLIHEEKDHKIIFSLIITIEKDNFGVYTLTVMKEKVFENMAIQRLKFSIHEISISFILSHNQTDNVTFQCYKAHLQRQKGVQLTDISLTIDKLLIRQGKGVSILNALHSNSKFLNAQIIINKSLKGISLKNLILKLVPIELTFKEKIIFKIIQKIADIRSQMHKNRLKIQQQKKYQKSSSNQSNHSDFFNKGELTLIKQSIERQSLQFGDIKLQKQWQAQLNKQIKGSKILIIGNMQISQTSFLISYNKDEYKKIDEKIAQDKIIKYVLLMPPISQLKISINHLTFNDFQGETKQFMQELMNKLKQSIGSTIANSFSSLPIFDNPIIAIDGLFKYLEGILTIK